MQNFSLYQLLVPTFSALMILRALSTLGRGGKTPREFIAILVVWTTLSLIAIFPHIFVDKIAAFLGIRSGINALFFFGFVVLFYLAFRLFISSEEQQEQLTEIVRQQALQEFKNQYEDLYHHPQLQLRQLDRKVSSEGARTPTPRSF